VLGHSTHNHDERDADPIPLSALQQAVYCLRQAALIHIERLWEENRFTAEGRVLHNIALEAGSRRSRDVRRVTALPLVSRRLNRSARLPFRSNTSAANRSDIGLMIKGGSQA
jgi:hypothetical protein